MLICDSHIHSNFSGDSKEELENIIEFALKNKIDEITITDHRDPDFPSLGSFSFDLDKYIATLKRLQQDVQDKLKINIGVEFGLQPHLLNEFNKISSCKDLDFIIGSTHAADKKDVAKEIFFKNVTKDEAHEIYFKETLENTKIFKDISVYGHIDFIRRYGKTIHEDHHILDYNKNHDIIEEILKNIISNGSGLEINTSAIRYGAKELYPNATLLKEYKRLGGEIITVGSDSHIAEHLTMDFDKAFDLLKECGFDYYSVFHKRKPEFIKLK